MPRIQHIELFVRQSKNVMNTTHYMNSMPVRSMLKGITKSWMHLKRSLELTLEICMVLLIATARGSCIYRSLSLISTIAALMITKK